MMGSDNPSKRRGEKGSVTGAQVNSATQKASYLQAMVHSFYDTDDEDEDDGDPFENYWNSFRQDFH
jgi:hypothetical protein